MRTDKCLHNMESWTNFEDEKIEKAIYKAQSKFEKYFDMASEKERYDSDTIIKKIFKDLNSILPKELSELDYYEIEKRLVIVIASIFYNYEQKWLEKGEQIEQGKDPVTYGILFVYNKRKLIWDFLTENKGSLTALIRSGYREKWYNKDSRERFRSFEDMDEIILQTDENIGEDENVFTYYPSELRHEFLHVHKKWENLFCIKKNNRNYNRKLESNNVIITLNTYVYFLLHWNVGLLNIFGRRSENIKYPDIFNNNPDTLEPLFNQIKGGLFKREKDVFRQSELDQNNSQGIKYVLGTNNELEALSYNKWKKAICLLAEDSGGIQCSELTGYKLSMDH